LPLQTNALPSVILVCQAVCHSHDQPTLLAMTDKQSTPRSR